MRTSFFAVTIAAISFLAVEKLAWGQMIDVGAPWHRTSDSYYENFGVSFGFRLPGGNQQGGSRTVGFGSFGNLGGPISFSQGSAASAIPQFGGFDPGSQATFGFGTIGPRGGGFSLGLSMGKGSTRSMTSVVPNVMVQNGMGGSIFDGSFRPFVTSVIPVIGNGQPVNGVTLAQASGQLDLSDLGGDDTRSGLGSHLIETIKPSSSAEAPVDSVQEIKARKERERQSREASVKEHLADAEKAIEEERYGSAKHFLKLACNLTSDSDQKSKLQMRIAEIAAIEKSKKAAKK